MPSARITGKLFVTLISIGSVPMYGKDVYVANGTCPGNGSVESPFCTIQAGIKAATQNKDRVMVLGGTYTGPGNTNLQVPDPENPQNPPVSITILCYLGECIIDCGNVSGRRGLTFNAGSGTSTLHGFTIRWGKLTAAESTVGAQASCHKEALRRASSTMSSRTAWRRGRRTRRTQWI